MAYSRAFSDVEIVSIATVAAAALGGIVIGLGRGQASQASAGPRLPDGARLSRELRHQVESHAPQAAEIRQRVRRGAFSAYESARDRIPDERPAPDLAAITRSLPVDGRKVADFTSALREVAERAASSSVLPIAIDFAVRAVHEGRKRPGSTLPLLGRTTREKVKPRAWLEHARAAMPSAADRDRIMFARRADAAAIQERLSEDLGSIGSQVGHAPEAVAAARARATEQIRKSIIQPATRAASTTKDVTMDSISAAAWLTLGAAVVYFGLLSSERRETVKNALCGAVEQVRLLALDLQGYEPEM